MAGQEIRRLDEVGGADGALGETQVGLGDAVGLLGVVLEIRLGVHTGVVADDLGGVLVGTHRTVAAQAPELAGHGVSGLGDERLLHIQGQVGHIVHHADGEELLGLVLGHVVEDGLDLSGGHVLGGQTIAAAIDGGGIGVIGIGGANVQIDSAGDGTGLLGAVHGGDLLHRLGHGAQEILHIEGAEQVDLEQAHLLAAGVEVVHHFAGGLAGRAHHDDDALSILGAVIIKDVVVTAGDLIDLGHVALHHAGDGVVVAVVGFLGLIVDIGALDGGTLNRVLGVHGQLVIGLQSVHIHQAGHLVQIDHLDLLNLVRGAEAVKEVDEGHPGLDRGQMGHGGQVHNLLDAGGGHHGDTGGTAAHHVLMIAEDVVGVLGHGAGGHVEHRGHPVTGHDVQVGDHQQQALGRGEGGGHGAGLGSAVEGAGGATLGLHLHQRHRLAEHVLAAAGGPLVHLFTHGRGGRDGENAGHVREMVGNGGAGLIAVHCFHDFFLRHWDPPIFVAIHAAYPPKAGYYILMTAPWSADAAVLAYIRR